MAPNATTIVIAPPETTTCVQFSPKRHVAYVPRQRSSLMGQLFYTSVEIDHFRQQAELEAHWQDVNGISSPPAAKTERKRPSLEDQPRVPSVRTLRSQLDQPRPRMERSASARTIRSSRPRRTPTRLCPLPPPPAEEASTTIDKNNKDSNRERAKSPVRAHRSKSDAVSSSSGGGAQVRQRRRPTMQRAASDRVVRTSRPQRAPGRVSIVRPVALESLQL